MFYNTKVVPFFNMAIILKFFWWISPYFLICVNSGYLSWHEFVISLTKILLRFFKDRAFVQIIHAHQDIKIPHRRRWRIYTIYWKLRLSESRTSLLALLSVRSLSKSTPMGSRTPIVGTGIQYSIHWTMGASLTQRICGKDTIILYLNLIITLKIKGVESSGKCKIKKSFGRTQFSGLKILISFLVSHWFGTVLCQVEPGTQAWNHYPLGSIRTVSCSCFHPLPFAVSNTDLRNKPCSPRLCGYSRDS